MIDFAVNLLPTANFSKLCPGYTVEIHKYFSFEIKHWVSVARAQNAFRRANSLITFTLPVQLRFEREYF